jgi:hypothetical protein
MPNLKQLLSKRKETYSLLCELIQALDEPLMILDSAGSLLLESGKEGMPAPQDRYELKHAGETLGWVMHSTRGYPLARLVDHLIQNQASQKTLGAEVLDRYRELNLLYNLAEKIGASLDLRTVAATALEEAQRLIRSTDGALLLFLEDHPVLSVAAAFGEVWDGHAWITGGILSGLASLDKAEIVNNLNGDERFSGHELPFRSLVFAPLKAKHRNLGLLLLCNRAESVYAAGDLKLLGTVAAQVAPSIENALLYEKTLHDAQERETRLKRQIEALRVELDEARQTRKVAEITETEYFQSLRGQADKLRRIFDDLGGSAP